MQQVGSENQLGALINIQPKKLHSINNAGIVDTLNRKQNAPPAKASSKVEEEANKIAQFQ